MNKNLLRCFIFLLTLPLSAFGSSFPSTILKMDPAFTHHVIVVEKSSHSLYIYKNSNGKPEFLKKYKIATGKIIGNKKVQGDKKTPEGIYTIKRFHTSDDLVKKYGKHGLIYGAGAFPLNFPNTIDKRAKKTGGGIWLHSTDDDKRISKGLDSRGCVVATDADLKDISKYIQLEKTKVIITQNHFYLAPESWDIERKKILKHIETWATAWKNKNFKSYINSYSKTKFKDARRGGYQGFKKYKKAIFSRKEKPQINFNNISILKTDQYAVVTLRQDYKSQLVKDTGVKTLYLQQSENYQWEIVSEEWSRLDLETMAETKNFTPMQTFFN